MNRRGAILPLLMVISLCAAWGFNIIGWTAYAHQLQSEKDDSHNKVDHIKECDTDFSADWNLLLFVFGDRDITKVKISLVEMESSPFKNSGIAGGQGLVYETKDHTIIKTIQAGFDRPLKYAVPDSNYGSGSSDSAVGHMEVFVNDDGNESSFIVGITLGGFVLNEKEHVIQRVFFSWAIAKQLDDILFAENGVRLSEEVFGALSGESVIKGSKKIYEGLQRKKGSSQILVGWGLGWEAVWFRLGA